MEYRQFIASDLPALESLWSTVFGDAYLRPGLSQADLETRTLDNAQFDAECSVVALEGDTPIGFVLSFAQQAFENDLYWEAALPGWIGAVLVHPEHQRLGIGSQLLQAAEASHTRKQRFSMMLGSSETLSAFFPGVDEAWDGAIRFFSHHGYRRMRPTVFVNIDLVHFSPPERVLEKIAELRESGIRMDLSSSDHESAYEAFMREQGHAGWEDRLEHWRSAPENTVVAIEGDRIVGEVPSLWAKEGRAGYGNIYTVSDYRGRGIGMGMLVKVMGVCRDRGAVTMPLWTRPETHERFYAKLGYFIERSYVVWGKALNVEILSPGWITRYH